MNVHSLRRYRARHGGRAHRVRVCRANHRASHPEHAGSVWQQDRGKRHSRTADLRLHVENDADGASRAVELRLPAIDVKCDAYAADVSHISRLAPLRSALLVEHQVCGRSVRELRGSSLPRRYEIDDPQFCITQAKPPGYKLTSRNTPHDFLETREPRRAGIVVNTPYVDPDLETRRGVRSCGENAGTNGVA